MPGQVQLVQRTTLHAADILTLEICLLLPLLDLSTELMRHQARSSAGAALMQLHKSVCRLEVRQRIAHYRFMASDTPVRSGNMRNFMQALHVCV